MRTVRLKDVGRRALADKRFFDGLVKDAEATLRAAGMSLREPDLKVLKLSFERKGAKLGRLIRIIRRVLRDAGVPPWDSDWIAPRATTRTVAKRRPLKRPGAPR